MIYRTSVKANGYRLVGCFGPRRMFWRRPSNFRRALQSILVWAECCFLRRALHDACPGRPGGGVDHWFNVPICQSTASKLLRRKVTIPRRGILDMGAAALPGLALNQSPLLFFEADVHNVC